MKNDETMGRSSMLRKLILVSGLGLAALGMGSINRADAQASIWNGYQGSSDVSLNFVPSAETGDPDLHYLGVSVSQTTIDQYGFAGRLEGRWSL